MPREFVHWFVLDRALRKSGETLTSDERSAAMLGALAHDAPYYHHFGRGEFQVAGNFLHGLDGQDTLDPVRTLVRNMNQSNQRLLRPFLLGMLSHVATDIVFHPMVFYHTGNYYHADPKEMEMARRRHRLFEVYLDSWMVKNGGAQVSRITLRRLMRNLGADIDPIIEALAVLDIPAFTASARERNDAWIESFETLALAQQMFVSPICGAVIRLGSKLGISYFQSHDSLFSFNRTEGLPLFQTQISYLNPVTGHEFKNSFNELLEEACKRCEQLFSAFQTATLDSLRGESLNYGIFGAGPSSAKYFAERPAV